MRKPRKPEPKLPRASLCYRCDHRAVALEDKLFDRFEGCPRSQCGDATYSAIDCYMYSPTKPVMLEPSESERHIKLFPGKRGRPRFCGGMLSGREQAAGVPEMVKVAVKYDGGRVVWFWQPAAAVEAFAAIPVGDAGRDRHDPACRKGGSR